MADAGADSDASADADAVSFQAIIDSELTCPICQSRFRTPKDLDCPHVYCKDCLQSHHRSKGGGPTIDCPECRLITVLPKTGIVGLKTSLRLRNLVEASEEQDKRQTTKRPPKVTVPECGQHEGEKLHLYCETDDYLVCYVCAVVDHPYPEHKCRNVKEVADEQKDRDMGILCKASVKLDELSQQSTAISNTECTIREFLVSEEAEILRCVRSIQTAVQRRGAAMINLLQQMHEEHISDLQEARDEIDDLSNRLSTVCEAVRENMNNSNDYKYVTQHQALYSNMMTLNQQRLSKTVDKSFPRIRFVPNNLGDENVAIVGHLQTSRVKDITADLCGHLTFGISGSKTSQVEKVVDIAAMADGSLVLLFESRLGVYHTQGKYENVDDEEYKLQLSLEPPVGFKDKPCWVGSPSAKASKAGTWLAHGVAVVDNKYVVVDRTPFVKIFSASGKFQSMFTTMKSLTSESSKISYEADDLSSVEPNQEVNFTCITQDVASKTIFLGDYARKVITTHDPSGKILMSFPLQDAPYKISIFGQRIAVTTIADRIDVLDKVTGETVLNVNVPLATGACIDMKSGCMFVTTTDPDSYEYENGTLEAYCSMTGKHIRSLVPMLYEPCGAMTLTPDNRLAVVDKEGVNLYRITLTYE